MSSILDKRKRDDDEQKIVEEVSKKQRLGGNTTSKKVKIVTGELRLDALSFLLHLTYDALAQHGDHYANNLVAWSWEELKENYPTSSYTWHEYIHALDDDEEEIKLILLLADQTANFISHKFMERLMNR